MNEVYRNMVYRNQSFGLKLEEFVTKRKYVPYRLNRHSKYEVGHTYWNAYWEKVYTVLEINGVKVKVQWEDGKIVEHCTSLDVKRDHELKPYPTDRFDAKKSYTAAEIKAFIYNKVFSTNLSSALIEKYFITDHSPNDYNCYFLCWSEKDGNLVVNLKRDLIKNPHNFYNIKTLGDVYNDKRIGNNYTRIDMEGNIIDPNLSIPFWTPVLDVKYVLKEGTKVILDVVQRNGHIYSRFSRNTTEYKYYISTTAPENVNVLYIYNDNSERFFSSCK